MLFGINSILTQFPVFIAGVVALVLSIGFHEFSHVLVAYSLGDRTGKDAGRLTLNPLKHLDPIGTLLILLGAFIGWGKPAPFNPNNLRYKRFGSAIVALGGPLSNFLMLAAASVALRVFFGPLGTDNLLVIFLQIFVVINASLLLFNLIPLPPLDGSWLLLALLPRSADPLREFLGRYGWYILMGLLVADFVLQIHLLTPYLSQGIDVLVRIFGLGPYLGGI
jgi:Zn-dependent protease